MGYRNPAYLAKVAATVDAISGGRVEMGNGAGWYEHEWRAYGYGFAGAGDRIGMLDEGVQIMRQLWTEGVATLDGKHYQVDGAICRPLPLQEGGIPLWIAGGGEKKTLRIAARYAAYANFDGPPEVFRRKSSILQEHCREAGTDFGAIVRSANYNGTAGRHPRADRRAAHAGQQHGHDLRHRVFPGGRVRPLRAHAVYGEGHAQAPLGLPEDCRACRARPAYAERVGIGGFACE